MEKFNLITQGELTTGTTLNEATEYLQHLKLPERAISSILQDRKHCVLKRNISLEQADKYKTVFLKGGLIVELDLQLSAECFHLGLTQATEQKKKQPEGKKNSTEMHRYELVDDIVQPTLLSSPQKTKVDCLDTQQTITVERIGHQWNAVLLLMAVAISSLVIELYLVRLMSIHLNMGYLSSLIGILYLLTSILIFPKLLQPLNVYRFKCGTDVFMLIEQYCWHPQKRHYNLWDDCGNILGAIFCNRESAEICDENSQLLFTWDKLLAVRSVGDERIEAIHEGAVSDLQSDLISTYWSYLQFALKIFKGRSRNQSGDWSIQAGTPIINRDRKLVGLIYQSDHIGLQVLPSEELEFNKLLAFSVAVLRTSV